MIERNPPSDGRGHNIRDNPELDEVRMFAKNGEVKQTGFNTGVFETKIEFKRWTGKSWVRIENPKLPR